MFTLSLFLFAVRAGLCFPQDSSALIESSSPSDIHCKFDGLEQAERVTEENEPCGVHIDGFVGLVEALPPLQLILVNGGSAAGFAQGNEIRTDISTLPFTAMDPQSVLAGCFFSRSLSTTLGALPSGSSLPLIGPFIEALRSLVRNQAGAASNPITCTITAKVIGMADLGGRTGEYRLDALRRDGEDTKTFTFQPAGFTLFGHGTVATKVQEFNLRDERWKSVTRITFDRTTDALTLGNSGIGAAGAVLDDFEAKGHRHA